MGSVKIETRNEGRGLREWDYVPLSEPRIVAQLIKNRWKVDEAFYPKEVGAAEVNPLGCNGVFPFSEPVLVSYMDLDLLIEEAPLTRAEKKVVEWLMQGYSGTDIADHCGTSKQNIVILLWRACEKIAATNNEHWKDVYAKPR